MTLSSFMHVITRKRLNEFAVNVLNTEEEYNRLVALLDSLVDEVGEDESHPLASLMEIIGVLVENYETEHVPELSAD